MKISIINTPFSILYKARTDLRTGSRTGSQQGSQIGSQETCEPNRTANRFAKPVREPNFANRPNPIIDIKKKIYNFEHFLQN